jgi:hypothetical protein
MYSGEWYTKNYKFGAISVRTGFIHHLIKELQ